MSALPRAFALLILLLCVSPSAWGEGHEEGGGDDFVEELGTSSPSSTRTPPVVPDSDPELRAWEGRASALLADPNAPESALVEALAALSQLTGSLAQAVATRSSLPPVPGVALTPVGTALPYGYGGSGRLKPLPSALSNLPFPEQDTSSAEKLPEERPLKVAGAPYQAEGAASVGGASGGSIEVVVESNGGGGGAGPVSALTGWDPKAPPKKEKLAASTKGTSGSSLLDGLRTALEARRGLRQAAAALQGKGAAVRRAPSSVIPTDHAPVAKQVVTKVQPRAAAAETLGVPERVREPNLFWLGALAAIALAAGWHWRRRSDG